MTPIEKQLLDTLKMVGSYPSRYKLCADAGVPYAYGYYAIETLLARGYVKLLPPSAPRRNGRAQIIKLVEVPCE